MIAVAGLQFKHCCLIEGKLVKIPNSQITQPRQVTSVLAPLTLQLHTHKFLDQGPLETKHQHNNLAFLHSFVAKNTAPPSTVYKIIGLV